MRTLQLALVTAALALLPSTAIEFIHPGVFVGRPQLDFVASQVRSRSEPIYTAYTKALASPLGSLSYAPAGPPPSGVIECGPYSVPDLGCSDEEQDAAAAYLQTVLYYVTGTQTYAENAIRVLNAYGARLRYYNNSNAPLQAGWAASKWSRAAELVLHSGAGWKEGDVAAFIAMIHNASLPQIDHGSESNGNWELSQIEGLLGWSVFLNSSTLFERAVTYWTQRTRAYFYNVADGSSPIPAPRGDPSWYGQTVFNGSTSGVAQEFCRDLGHTSYSLAASVNAAETALLQGSDLYSNGTHVPFFHRMGTSMELAARFLLGVAPPAYLCGGTVDVNHKYPTMEVGYARLSTDFSLPLNHTRDYIQQRVRTNPDPYNHMAVYETLTHGALAPKAAARGL